MEQTLTLTKVQAAMRQLRENGERVSRRNVRAITGGGMSTVHRLMSQIQEAEALQASSESSTSPALRKALVAEIQEQIGKATSNLQDRIAQLKEREEEALSALAQAEETISALEAELQESASKVRREQEVVQRSEGSVQALQSHFDRTLQAAREEIHSLRSDLEMSRLEKERVVFQVEKLEQDFARGEAREKQLQAELSAARQQAMDLEVRAATAQKQVADQQKRLARMERRLEDRATS